MTQVAWNKGKTWKTMFSPERLELMLKERASRKGKNNPLWKGENAKKGTIHDWIVRHYGKPNLCEICGTTEKKMYHWANKNHTYKRIRKDWLRLCVSCHTKYDGNYKKRKRNEKGQFTGTM